MKTISLSEETDELIARAQAIATVLAEKRDELGISTDVEALLRASIAAATYAINGYVALTAARNPGSPSAIWRKRRRDATETSNFAPASHASCGRTLAADG